jgi:hypothetical protein
LVGILTIVFFIIWLRNGGKDEIKNQSEIGAGRQETWHRYGDKPWEGYNKYD